jgi:hypothetical protein
MAANWIRRRRNTAEVLLLIEGRAITGRAVKPIRRTFPGYIDAVFYRVATQLSRTSQGLGIWLTVDCQAEAHRKD